MTKKSMLLAGCVLSTGVLATGTGWAAGMRHYEVSITNLTPGQPLAPALVVTHRPGMSFFEAGAAPAPELAPLAEAGDGNPMAEALRGMPEVDDVEVASGGTAPGSTTTVTVAGRPGDHFSYGAMLGNTNDAFAGLADVALPFGRWSVTYMAVGYDAGTETNDESCATVPGPACGGEALSPGDPGEGFVTVHNGIHGIGDLDPALLDWRNPVAKIVIKVVR